MKLKLSIIGLALLASALPSFAGGIVMMGGGVAVAGGDGVIGTTGHAGSDEQGGADTAFFSSFTTTTAGSVQYGHMYVVDGNNNTVCIALYDSSGNVLAYASGAAGNNTSQWVNVDFGTPVTLSAATTYWLGYQPSTSTVLTVGLDSGTGAIRKDNSHTYSCGSGIADDAQETANGKLSIIVNNTAGSPE